MNTEQRPGDLYKQLWDANTAEDRLTPEEVRRVSGILRREFLRLFLFANRRNVHQRAREGVLRLADTARHEHLFDMRFEGADVLKDCDLLLANHQGPRGLGKGTAQGGLETLFANAIVPDNTRFLLGNMVVNRRTLSIKDFVRACVIRLKNPIVLYRPTKEACANRSTYVSQFREERRRAFTELFRAIVEDGTPGLIYPEGQRSPTGEILPLMADLFEVALESYVEPLTQVGRDPRIGLVIADTMQVFPQGFGAGAPLYRKPLTIRGVIYDTTELMGRVRMCRTPQDRKMLARWFCMHVQRCMRKELSKTLTA